MLPWGIAKIKSYLQKRRAEKQKESPQDRSSRRTASATVWIAFFALIAALVGVSQAIIANRQLNALKAQIDAMQADQRPWISLSADLVEPLNYSAVKGVYDVAVWHTTIRPTLKNVGRSPATNLDFFARIMPFIIPGFPDGPTEVPGEKSETDIILQMRRTCGISAIVQAAGFGTGSALFPNELPKDVQFPFGGNPDDFEQAKKPHSGYTGKFLVLLCVIYFFGDTEHGTAKAYELSKQGGDINLSGENIPLRNLKFIPLGLHNSLVY